MLLIDDVLVSEEVFEESFHCHLEKCLGACCWEGDFGAPVRKEEVPVMESLLPKVRAVLPPENQRVLDEKGATEWYREAEVLGTPLMPDLACAFLIREPGKPGACAFELLYRKGLIEFKKPVSCELYPLRLLENEEVHFTAINYDRWDICQPACELGRDKKLPVFQFVKSGLVRKFGQEFYEHMEAFFHNQYPDV